MRKAIFAALCVCAGLMLAQTAAHQNVFTPEQVKYGPPPAFVPPGSQLAVIEGDPFASSGDYTVRLKMPDGYKIAPQLASQAGKRDRALGQP